MPPTTFYDNTGGSTTSKSLTFWDYKMFWIDTQGKIYHWMTQRQQVPPQQIDLNIYFRNLVDDIDNQIEFLKSNLETLKLYNIGTNQRIGLDIIFLKKNILSISEFIQSKKSEEVSFSHR